MAKETDSYISYFTPSEMSAETLEFIFVKREKLAARLVENVRQSVLTNAKHQNLLVGPRGVGKSHMVALAYHRVKGLPELEGKIAIAWLAEEEWAVGSLVDFYIVILEALEREYGGLRARIDALYDLPDDKRTVPAADLIHEFVGERTLFLLVENLEEIFKGLTGDELWSLRSFLSQKPFVTLLATTPSLFSGIEKQREAFFGFFQHLYLPGLSVKEATNLLEKLAERRGDAGLTNFLKTETAQDRVRAVHELAGGHPRIYLLFAHLLTQSNMESLVVPFMEFLDELTPYFQDRMKGFSTQQRKIVTFLCDQRGAVSVRDIVARTNGMTSQTVSSQLNRLDSMGYVVKTPVGRESFYELREPLLRMIVEKKRGRGEPIRLVVDFLRRWYSRDERRARMARSRGMDATYWQASLDLNRAVQDTPDPSRADNLLFACRIAQLNKKYNRAADIAAEIIERKGNSCKDRDWLLHADCLYEAGNYEDCIKSCEESVALNPKNDIAWNNLGLALRCTSRYEDALRSYDKAITLNPENSTALSNKSIVLAELERYDAAFNIIDEALKRKPENVRLLIAHANIFLWQGRYSEALEILDNVLSLAPEEYYSLSIRGYTLNCLSRYAEALESVNRAIALAPRNHADWSNKGAALIGLSRYDAAMESLDKAIALNPKSARPSFHKGKIYLRLNQWHEFQKAVETGFALAPSRDVRDYDAEDYCLVLLQSGQVEKAEKVAWLVEIYEKYNAVGTLGQGFLESIRELAGAEISQARAEEWRDVWNRAGANQAALVVPLRLLSAAVAWKPKHDVRALLALAIEERRVLEQILEIASSDSDKPSAA